MSVEIKGSGQFELSVNYFPAPDAEEANDGRVVGDSRQSWGQFARVVLNKAVNVATSVIGDVSSSLTATGQEPPPMQREVTVRDALRYGDGLEGDLFRTLQSLGEAELYRTANHLYGEELTRWSIEDVIQEIILEKVVQEAEDLGIIAGDIPPSDVEDEYVLIDEEGDEVSLVDPNKERELDTLFHLAESILR